jgi:hypothetical protein
VKLGFLRGQYRAHVSNTPQRQVDLLAAELQRLVGDGFMGTDRNTSG